MDKFGSVSAVLEFAIEQETQAEAFYRDLARQVKNPAMKKLCTQFAEEEKGHRAKLIKVKAGKPVTLGAKKVANLAIGDYLVEEPVSPDLDYPRLLILAMQKEKAAFKLYTAIAESLQDEKMRSLFLALAQEEAKHKLRFELEYDDNLLTEN